MEAWARPALIEVACVAIPRRYNLDLGTKVPDHGIRNVCILDTNRHNFGYLGFTLVVLRFRILTDFQKRSTRLTKIGIN